MRAINFHDKLDNIEARGHHDSMTTANRIACLLSLFKQTICRAVVVFIKI